MTSSVVRLRTEIEAHNREWERNQLGKAIEVVGVCLFRYKSSHDSEQFVKRMQRQLMRRFIETRREFMTYYIMMDRHVTDPLGEVTSKMVKQGAMMQILGQIDKGQLPELYTLILAVGKSLGKVIFAWTNSVMDKLGDVGIEDIIQLAYKACD